MDSQGIQDQIRQGLNPAMADLGVVVEEVKVQSAGKRRLLRISIARDVAALLLEDSTSPVEPLTLDEVADASRRTDQWLEESNVMGERPYTLEVTSLGVSHPLTTAAQLRRNVGRLVQVELRAAPEVTGRIESVSPEQFTLRTEKSEVHTLSVSDLNRATVQVEFTRANQKEGI